MENVNPTTESAMTAKAYLGGVVAFPIPEDAINAIMLDRGVSGEALYPDVERKLLALCKADMLRWLCTSPTSVGGTTDKDNSWEHSDRGYSLDKATRASLIAQANEIYAEYGEPLIGRQYIRVRNHGICRANRPASGTCGHGRL